MRIVGIIFLGLLALAAGAGGRYLFEKTNSTITLVAPTPIAPSAPPAVQPLPAVSTTTTSNASVTFKEITEWLATLPATVRTDIGVAGSLLTEKYRTQRLRTAYSQYDGCINYVLSVAVTGISASNIQDLTRKPLAYAALVPDTASSTTVTAIKKDLLTTLIDVYLMPDVVAAVGSNAVAAVEVPRSTLISKSSCANLSVPAKFK